jgi:hypothetical protein
MAKAKALTAADLQNLGAERLAALLLSAAEADTILMRSLRVEVAGRDDPSSAAGELDAWIKSLRRAKRFVDRNGIRDLVRELQALSDAIEGTLAEADPMAAFGLMLAFLDLAPSLIERSDDDGDLGYAFHEACTSAARLAALAVPRLPIADAVERAYRIYIGDDYGVADGIIADFAQALGAEGCAMFRRRIETDLAGMTTASNDEISAGARIPEWKLLRALSDVADALGDVDAYCAVQQRLGARVRDDAGMAKRLIEMARFDDALAVLDTAEPSPAKSASTLADLRVVALEALGRGDEAQAMRWREFIRGFRPEPLREFLKRLPDFEDFEKEQEALDLVAREAEPHRALAFLAEWPDVHRASALVLARSEALDGNAYWSLTPAAESLEAKAPLAASLLYRRMIDFTLERARSTRYEHAARHLESCGWLAHAIADWEGHPSHESYVAGLRQRHGRKTGFWSRVTDEETANAGD